MDLEEELGVCSVCSWLAVDGSLGQFVQVVGDSEGKVKPGVNSRSLLLVPSTASSGPCELTVKFQQRACYVHQICIQSTARTCEVYSQKEGCDDLEYVCTVRASAFLSPEQAAMDAELLVSASVEPVEAHIHSQNGLAGSSKMTHRKSVESSVIRKHELLPTCEGLKENITIGSRLSHAVDDALSISSMHSGEVEMCHSYKLGSPRKLNDGSLAMEESLDQTEWVECSHSTMPTGVLSSDDEVEAVELNKSGYLLVESHGERQQAECPHTVSYAGADSPEDINNCLVKSLETNDKEPSLEGLWNRSMIQESPGSGINFVTTNIKHGDSVKMNIGEQSQKVQKSDSIGNLQSCLLNDIVDSDLRKSWNKGNTCAESNWGQLDVNIRHPWEEELTSGGDHSMDRTMPKIPQHNSCAQNVVESKNDHHMAGYSRSTYEAKVNLVNSEVWTAVTIRLLSLEDKSRVEIHQVVVSVVPKSASLLSANLVGTNVPDHVGSGSSSLLSLLVPAMLHMARGVPEKLAERPNLAPITDSSTSQLVQAYTSLIGRQSASGRGPSAAMLASTENVGQPFLREGCLRGQDDTSCKADKGQGHVSLRNADIITEYVTDASEVVGNSRVYSSMCENKTLKAALNNVGEGERLERSLLSQTSNLQTAAKEPQLMIEVLDRLSRLEAVCLRIENSVTHALESFGQRLTLMESLTFGRLPTYGHLMAGEACDHHSAVSTLTAGSSFGSVGGGTCSENEESQQSTALLSTHAPLFPGLLSSPAPSIVSSASAVLPLWPISSSKGLPHSSPADSVLLPDSKGQVCCFSLPQVSMSGADNEKTFPDSLFHDFNLSLGTGNYSSQSISFEGSELDNSSQHTSDVDHYDEQCFSSCPVSFPSSPIKPVKSVDHAWASALSAFMTSFEYTTASKLEDEAPQAEDEEKSVVGELPQSEQYECFSVDGDQGAFLINRAEVDVHSEEYLLPPGDEEYLSVPKTDVHQDYDLSFCENKASGPANWELQDGVKQQEDEIAPNKKDESVSVGVLTGYSKCIIEEPSLELTDLIFPQGAQALTKHSETVINGSPDEKDTGRNPFLKSVPSAQDTNHVPLFVTWLQEAQTWSGKSQESIQELKFSAILGSDAHLSSQKMSILLPPHDESLLAEEEWKLSIGEPTPLLSLVDEKQMPDMFIKPKDHLTLNMSVYPWLEYSGSEVDCLKDWHARQEQRSLLDEDPCITVCDQGFSGDSPKQSLEKTDQWSLLDDDVPVDPCMQFLPQEKQWLRHKEQRSLLDEDPSMFSRRQNVSYLKSDLDFHLSDMSLGDPFSCSALCSPKHRDLSQSPSSQTSRPNPFDDDVAGRLDASQTSNGTPLNYLEAFGEDYYDFRVSVSDPPPTLLFHLSL